MIGDGTDAADPGRDIGHLGKPSTAEEPFEESRRLIDVEFGDFDAAIVHADAQGPQPLDACQ